MGRFEQLQRELERKERETMGYSPMQAMLDREPRDGEEIEIEGREEPLRLRQFEHTRDPKGTAAYAAGEALGMAFDAILDAERDRDREVDRRAREIGRLRNRMNEVMRERNREALTARKAIALLDDVLDYFEEAVEKAEEVGGVTPKPSSRSKAGKALRSLQTRANIYRTRLGVVKANRMEIEG